MLKLSEEDTHCISSFRKQTHPMRWIRPDFGYSTPVSKLIQHLLDIILFSHPCVLKGSSEKAQFQASEERKKTGSFDAVVLKHIIRGTLMHDGNFSQCCKVRRNSMACVRLCNQDVRPRMKLVCLRNVYHWALKIEMELKYSRRRHTSHSHSQVCPSF